MSIADVLSGARRWHIETCRAEELEPRLPDGCVDLILTDPPFHKVKDLAWDREHKTAGGFLDWLGERLAAWRRILAPNGSLYVFASPAMAWGVEGKVREHFSLLARATWCKTLKHTPAHYKMRKESLRNYFPSSEAILFAEQNGSDAIALGESLYGARCDALRGEVFEPMRAYLDGERERAGLDRAACDAACGNQMSGHYFSRVQWALPTATNYEKLRAAAPGFFLRPWGDLKREHDALRERYDRERETLDHLRRPFTVSAAVPYTDVWHYTTVKPFDGKHPCEKPPEMALDIVRASSRPGGLTLDLFGGSFVFSAAAVALGRRAIACDMDPHWCEVGRERCRLAEETGQIVTRARRAPKPGMPPESGPRIRQLDLFSGPA